MPEDVYDGVATMAGLLGKTKAEYIRGLIERDLFGSLAYARTRVGISTHKG